MRLLLQDHGVGMKAQSNAVLLTHYFSVIVLWMESYSLNRSSCVVVVGCVCVVVPTNAKEEKGAPCGLTARKRL